MEGHETKKACKGACRRTACRFPGSPSNGFHGGTSKTGPGVGKKAYTTCHNSPRGSRMISLTHGSQRTYTFSPISIMSSKNHLACSSVVIDEALTMVKRCLSPFGTTSAMRDIDH